MKPSRPGRRSPLRSLGTITATVIVVLAIQSLVGPGRPLQPPAVLSPWVRQAEQDFRPFAGGINREMVERAANVFPAFKVIIRDNELYVRTAPPGELNYIMKVGTRKGVARCGCCSCGLTFLFKWERGFGDCGYAGPPGSETAVWQKLRSQAGGLCCRGATELPTPSQ